MIKNWEKLKISSFISVFIILVVIFLFCLRGNNSRTDSTNVLPIFYYEDLVSSENQTRTVMVEEDGDVRIIEPYMRTFFKAIPQSIFLLYGNGYEEVVAKCGYLLSYCELRERKVAVFDELFSKKQHKAFSVWVDDDELVSIDYADNEYYIKTVPTGESIYLYTYELREYDAMEETVIKLYKIDYSGNIKQYMLDLRDVGIGIENLNLHTLHYFDSKWCFSATVNQNTSLYIMDTDSSIKRLEWKGSIVSLIVTDENLYLVSTQQEESVITKFNINKGDVIEVSRREEVGSFLIMERSVYLYDNVLYYFVVDKTKVTMVATDIHTGFAHSYEYQNDSRGILMDILLMDRLRNYLLIPGVEEVAYYD